MSVPIGTHQEDTQNAKSNNKLKAGDHLILTGEKPLDLQKSCQGGKTKNNWKGGSPCASQSLLEQLVDKKSVIKSHI